MDSKRKGQTATATENSSSKKAKVDDVVKPELKEASVQAPLTNYPDSAPFFMKMINTKAMSIKTRDEIIFSCERTDNLTQVFKGLINHRFLSVPVFQQTDKKRWYGFVDLFDIVRYVTSHFGSEKMALEQDFWKLSEAEEKFKSLTVNDVIRGSSIKKEKKYCPITQQYTLYSAFEIFARDPNIHRIPILDNNSNRHLLSILTQSQLINFVYENLPLLGSKKDLLVKNMIGIENQVITCKSSVLAIDAFKLIEENNINGIGIVNDAGQLIDTLSVRDLKGISADGALFWKLYKPVEEFLEFLKNDLTTLRPRNAMYVYGNDTFETVLTKIYTNQIHRIFIVDSFDSKKPIGVISLSDLLLQLFP